MEKCDKKFHFKTLYRRYLFNPLYSSIFRQQRFDSIGNVYSWMLPRRIYRQENIYFGEENIFEPRLPAQTLRTRGN